MNRYIIPIFLIILSVAGYIRYIDPYYGAVMAGKTKIEEYDKLLADAQAANDKLDLLRTTEEGFPEGFERSLDIILPESIDPLRLVIDIDGIAALKGLHIKEPEITIPSTANGKVLTGLQENKLSFTVSAPYDVFQSFLRDLELSLSLQDLSGLSFTSVVPNEGVAAVAVVNPQLRTYDYQVTVTTYSLPK
jgi:hypothetical protein